MVKNFVTLGDQRVARLVSRYPMRATPAANSRLVKILMQKMRGLEDSTI